MNMIALTMVRGVGIDEDEREVEQTAPVVINADFIRCFYPRKNDRPGTRITFVDGHGFAVTQDPASVAALMRAAGPPLAIAH